MARVAERAVERMSEHVDELVVPQALRLERHERRVRGQAGELHQGRVGPLDRLEQVGPDDLVGLSDRAAAALGSMAEVGGDALGLGLAVDALVGGQQERPLRLPERIGVGHQGTGAHEEAAFVRLVDNLGDRVPRPVDLGRVVVLGTGGVDVAPVHLLDQGPVGGRRVAGERAPLGIEGDDLADPVEGEGGPAGWAERSDRNRDLEPEGAAGGQAGPQTAVGTLGVAGEHGGGKRDGLRPGGVAPGPGAGGQVDTRQVQAERTGVGDADRSAPNQGALRPRHQAAGLAEAR